MASITPAADTARDANRIVIFERIRTNRLLFRDRRLHGWTIGISRIDRFQNRAPTPFKALTVVYVTERTNEIQIHHRENSRRKSVRRRLFFQPIEDDIDAVALTFK
jgi:hypothetical protein